jgi:hypothetical protein
MSICSIPTACSIGGSVDVLSNDCSKHHGSCEFSSTQCCWCLDKRTEITIYMDSYGTFDPTKFDCPVPRDLYYCSHCKLSTTPTAGLFLENLRNILPNPSDFARLCDIDKKIEDFKSKIAIRRKISKENETKLQELNAYRSKILKEISMKGMRDKSNRII